MAEDDKKPNIFFRQSLYPDAEGIFAFRPKSLAEIKDECFVVLDTNSLLVPYTIRRDRLEQIEKIYKDLVSENRLVVPGQVAREFAEHRVTKLKELYQQFSKKKVSIDLGSYPLLGSLDEYQKALELEKNLTDSIHAYNSAIAKILEVISKWYWDDPVSKLYSALFSENVVFDPSFKENDMKQRMEKDVLHKLPPGYKDAQKEDSGIGDLIIWQTILEVGKKNQKSIIFVSLDQKGDWWSKSEGRPLYPRFELVDEFRRESGGHSFHIVRFSDFLDLYGASEEVVEAIRMEESILPQPIDDFERIYKDIHLLESYERWRSTEEGVRSAQQEIEKLHEELKGLVEQNNSTFSTDQSNAGLPTIDIAFRREHNNRFMLSSRGICLFITWNCIFANTLDDSVLLVEAYKCKFDVDGHLIFTEQDREYITEYDIDMNRDLTRIGWRNRSFRDQVLTSNELARDLFRYLLGAIRRGLNK